MSYQNAVVTTEDGRALEVASVGDPAGPTIFFHHGTPGAASLLKSFSSSAEQHGVFMVSMSRAGYGSSGRRAGRVVASVVDDVRAALDHFGRDRYLTIGWSGGGPHALACAALDAPRCVAAWSLAGVAPANVDFDWTEGMGPENIEEFELARQGGPEYEAHIKSISEAFADANEANIIAYFGGLLSDVDVAALADDTSRSVLAEACRDSGRTGYFGFIDDDQAFMSDWGFDLRDISTPTNIWFGDHDLMVPPTHGAYLSAHVPGAVAVHRPDEGHVSLVSNHQDELFTACLAAWH